MSAHALATAPWAQHLARRRARIAAELRAALVELHARDTEHLQEIVNLLLATPAIRRCTSYIVLTRQVPPRTAPLIEAAARSSRP